MKRLFIAVVALFIFVGCADKSSSLEIYDVTRNEKNNESGPWARPHFIANYVVPHELGIGTTIDPKYFYLREIGDLHKTWDQREELSEEAKYFINLYGDTKLNGNSSLWGESAVAYPIDWITITCDKDFDAEHPAGEPLLEDVVKLEYNTYYNFVKSGLTAYKYDQNDDPRTDRYEIGFDKVNADITKLMDISLAHDYFATAGIRFQYVPEVDDEYTFTITLKMNGEEMKTSFTTTFE